MRPTLATLKSRAKKLGLVVEDDIKAGTLYVETVPGEVFVCGTHYFAEYHDNDPAWRREAIETMLETLEGERGGLVERCLHRDCDWCTDG